MAQRSVYIPDNVYAVLEHEARVNPRNTPGRLLVALARGSLGLPLPMTVTGAVLHALSTSGDDGLDVVTLSSRADLGRRVVGETLAVLSRLTPSPVEVVSGAGRDARWALASAVGAVDESDEAAA